jgi:acetyl esterase/lipase
VWNRRKAIGYFGASAAVSLVGATACARSLADNGDNPAASRYAYGPGPSQFAELTLPNRSTPAPVVVIVHGGFWRTGFGIELGRPLAGDLAGRGFATLNVEYRRVDTGDAGGGGWPQTGQDVADAVDALATDGQRLAEGRLDLTRVIGLGHSAGGQLVAWLAGRRAPTVKLRALVSQAGVLDLTHAVEVGTGNGSVEEFMGGSPTTKPAAYAQASPIALLPIGVPSVCVHGRADSVVPIDQSESLVAVCGGAHTADCRVTSADTNSG